MADLKGLKRICMSCGARFYDLNKKPIVCPSCSVEFTGEIKVKARRGRLPADSAVDAPILDDEDVEVEEIVEEVETEEIEQDEELVSLEEIEEDDDDDIAEDDDDIDLDDELAIDDDLEDLDEEIEIEEEDK